MSRWAKRDPDQLEASVRTRVTRVIALEEAKQFVLGALSTLEPVEVPLNEALGAVAAEEFIAHEAVPGFTNSSMDGFAVRAADTRSGAAQLRVIDSVYAGNPSSRRVHQGEAMRIMTGAPLPEGADAVCMIEQVVVSPDGQSVQINRIVETGDFLRHPGEDIARGQRLLSVGELLTPARLGVLASQGVGTVRVFRRPRVGVLSTGDELAETADELGPGEIRDVNRPLLMALVAEAQCTPIDLGVVADDYDAITERLGRAVEHCDAVLSTGGVSMGDVDHVKAVITALGGPSARWMQVALRPGKPFAFGVSGARHTPIFGLPGNPVSTRVSFEMFVRPALRLLAGHAQYERATINAVADIALARTPDGKLHVVHVVARFHDDGRVHVEQAVRHGSHLLNATVGANALALVPDGDGIEAGDVVGVLLVNGAQL